jgi:hypothetical protein
MELKPCDFKFVCSKAWDELQPTFSAGVRYCDQSCKDVFLVKNKAQFAEARRLRRCVAWLRPQSTSKFRTGGPLQLLGDAVL